MARSSGWSTIERVSPPPVISFSKSSGIEPSGSASVALPGTGTRP
jgi:hypothetical protein